MKVSTESENWRRWEREVEADIQGRTTAGSGNTAFDKNDVRTRYWSLDCKTTDKKSFSIKKDFWDSHKADALFDGCSFAMPIKIQDTKLVVVDYEDWLELNNAKTSNNC